MKYYIKNLEANIIVAEYVAESPVLPSSVDALYSSSNFVTLNESFEIVGIQPNVIRYSAFDFLRRFTLQERISIRIRSKLDPNIEDFMGMLDKADNVYNTDPDTVMALNYLVAIGEISELRKTQILGE